MIGHKKEKSEPKTEKEGFWAFGSAMSEVKQTTGDFRYSIQRIPNMLKLFWVVIYYLQPRLEIHIIYSLQGPNEAIKDSWLPGTLEFVLRLKIILINFPQKYSSPISLYQSFSYGGWGEGGGKHPEMTYVMISEISETLMSNHYNGRINVY